MVLAHDGIEPDDSKLVLDNMLELHSMLGLEHSRLELVHSKSELEHSKSEQVHSKPVRERKRAHRSEQRHRPAGSSCA